MFSLSTVVTVIMKGFNGVKIECMPYHQSLLCTAFNHNLWDPYHMGFEGEQQKFSEYVVKAIYKLINRQDKSSLML